MFSTKNYFLDQKLFFQKSTKNHLFFIFSILGELKGNPYYIRFTEDGDIDESAEAEIRGVDRFNERQSVYCQRQNQNRHAGSAPRLW